VLGGGLAFSLLGAAMTWLLTGARSRAMAQAEKITRELQLATESSRRLALVASLARNGVMLTDVEGRVEWMNDAYIRATGYSLEEMKGRKPGTVLQGAETAPGAMAQMSAGLITQQDFTWWCSITTSPGGRSGPSLKCSRCMMPAALVPASWVCRRTSLRVTAWRSNCAARRRCSGSFSSILRWAFRGCRAAGGDLPRQLRS